MDMLEFGKLLTVIETATQSPITSKRILAVQILVDLSGKVNEVSEFSGLPQRVSSTIIDLFTMLLQPLPDSGRLESEVKEEGQHLLKILLLMVEKHPNLTVWMLEKTFSSIEYLLNKQIVGFEGEEWFSSVTMKLLVFLHKFVLACIEKRNEAALSNQVKVLIEHIQESSFINYYTRTVYSLLLHSCFISCLSGNDDKDIPSRDKDVGKSSKKCLVDQEIIALELAKKMLEEKEYWFVWKAGKYAASCGSWFMAAFIFGEITNKFQSKVCSWWLKSLAEFAHSEWRLQLILLEKHGSGLTNLLKMKNITIPLRDDLGEISEEIASNFHSASYTEELVAAYSGIRSSGEKLAEILISNQDFFFQRWFLNLRSQVLETVVDLLRILNSDSAMYFLTKRSFQLKRLAQEYDLLATSFIDMDYKSSRTVTFLAISCSLLAFSTGFPLLINGSQVCSNSMLIQPLLRQLWNIDHETCSDLMLLLGLSEPESCFHLQSRNQTFEAREIIKVCSYAVKRYVGLKKKSEGENNGKNLGQLTNESLQLIFDILKRWLSIPSRVPNYFFYPRHCVGSELFAFNNDTRKPDATMMVLPGCQLSLSLCLQMKNIPSELPVKITKLYCILHSSTSFDMSKLNGESKEKSQSQLRFQDWTIDEMVDLNEKLHHYVSETAENTKHRRKRDDDNNGLSINSFVCFELNERRQGFSTCLLDVSAFPMGCYRIKWHSCCIDNHGSYWSLLPLNSGPVFTIHKCIGDRKSVV